MAINFVDKCFQVEVQFLVNNCSETLLEEVVSKFKYEFFNKEIEIKRVRFQEYVKTPKSYLCYLLLYSQRKINVRDLIDLFDVNWVYEQNKEVVEEKWFEFESAVWDRKLHECEAVVDPHIAWIYIYSLRKRFLYRSPEDSKLYWQITKYDSKNRDKNGVYLKDEWTSYSDIGKTFDGEKLTFEEYKKIENAYIDSIVLFMNLTDTKHLFIVSLSRHDKPKHDDHYSHNMVNAFTQSSEGLSLNKNQVELIIRLILREDLWCELKAENMCVNFDCDYYMSIGASKYSEIVIQKVESLGLFVEDCKFPIIQEDDETPDRCLIF